MSNNLYLGDQHALRMLELAYEADLPSIEIDPLIFDNVEPVNRNDIKGKYFELLDLFYPDVDLFLDEGGAPSTPGPSYKVVCRTPEELALAYILRPNGVEADIKPDYITPETAS